MALRPLALLFPAAVAALTACAQPGSASEGPAQDMVAGEPVGWLELRVESEDARVQEFVLPDGTTAWFGPPTWFPLGELVAEERPEGPVVRFAVEDSVRADFRSYTGRHVGRRLGVFADGVCLTAPVLQAPLPGTSVLHGGRNGWDLAACERIRAQLAALRPAPQGAEADR